MVAASAVLHWSLAVTGGGVGWGRDLHLPPPFLPHLYSLTHSQVHNKAQSTKHCGKKKKGIINHLPPPPLACLLLLASSSSLPGYDQRFLDETCSSALATHLMASAASCRLEGFAYDSPTADQSCSSPSSIPTSFSSFIINQSVAVVLCESWTVHQQQFGCHSFVYSFLREISVALNIDCKVRREALSDRRVSHRPTDRPTDRRAVKKKESAPIKIIIIITILAAVVYSFTPLLV